MLFPSWLARGKKETEVEWFAGVRKASNSRKEKVSEQPKREDTRAVLRLAIRTRRGQGRDSRVGGLDEVVRVLHVGGLDGKVFDEHLCDDKLFDAGRERRDEKTRERRACETRRVREVRARTDTDRARHVELMTGYTRSRGCEARGEKLEEKGPKSAAVSSWAPLTLRAEENGREFLWTWGVAEVRLEMPKSVGRTRTLSINLFTFSSTWARVQNILADDAAFSSLFRRLQILVNDMTF